MDSRDVDVREAKAAEARLLGLSWWLREVAETATWPSYYSYLHSISSHLGGWVDACKTSYINYWLTYPRLLLTTGDCEKPILCNSL